MAPLEAMTCGCPVVISEQPALVEIGGDAALQCRADDVDAIARHMQALHGDDALRARLSAAGRARAQQFTWRSTGRNFIDYCRALTAGRAARAAGYAPEASGMAMKNPR